MAAENVDLVRELVGGGDDVDRVGVLGDETKGLLLAGTADEDAADAAG